MIGSTGAGNIDVSGEAGFHVAMSVMHAPDDAVSLHFLFAFILYFYSNLPALLFQETCCHACVFGATCLGAGVNEKQWSCS